MKRGIARTTLGVVGGICVVLALAGFAVPARALDRKAVQDLAREARSLEILTKLFDRREALPTNTPGPVTHGHAIRHAAQRYDIPAPLIAAVIRCESNWNPDARSPAGARGLMQVMPDTALGTFGVQPSRLWDPSTNINVGTAYLRILANRYQGNAANTIAAYNAGPTRVDRGARLPKETLRYRACVSRWHAVYADFMWPNHP